MVVAGDSALATGLAFAPMTEAILAANLTSGKLARAIGVRRVIASGAVMMAAGCAGLLGVDAATGYLVLVIPFAAIGFGLGSVDRSRPGVAAGTLNTARQTGSVLGVAAFGSLIAGGRLVPGLHMALAISVSAAVAAAVLTRLLAAR